MLRNCFIEKNIRQVYLSFLRPKVRSYHVQSRKVAEDKDVIKVWKHSIPQSPLKIKSLISLIRGAWVPDAMAQLKFSPKHRAVDIAKIVNRAIGIAKHVHNLVPEELFIKEVFVTKGPAKKQIGIMGKGRTGMGYKRSSHVWLKVARLDFSKSDNSMRLKKKLSQIKEIVDKKKNDQSTIKISSTAVAESTDESKKESQ